jgi:hypothetical protein
MRFCVLTGTSHGIRLWEAPSEEGRTPELGLETKARQEYISVGLGYMSARVSGLEPPMAGPQSIMLGGPKISLCFGLQLFGND